MKMTLVIIAAFSLSFGVTLSGCSSTPSNRGEAPAAKRTTSEISDLYTEMGTAALVSDDLPRAMENLRIALKYNSDNHIAHNHLGLALLGLGKRDDAKASFERAVSIKQDYSDAYVNLGTWYFAKSDNDTAKHYYDKALENLEYKGRYRAFTSLGQIAMTKGKADEARKLFYQALSENPSYCLAHLLLGSLYLRDGNTERAAGEFKSSIKGTCANNIEGQYQLGLAYTKLKEFKKARVQFHQIQDQFPNTSLAEEAGQQLRALP